ncbi:hypothetical protein Gpo141_00002396 [Globisporangium polare]
MVRKPSADSSSTQYDQRLSKDVSDESKRRKFLRWVKTKIGIPEDPSKEELRRQLSSSTRSIRSSRDSHESREFTSSVASSIHSAPSIPFLDQSVSSLYSHQSFSNHHRQHVIIIGAGIGGLCLAQGLKKHGIPFTVFERDPTPNFRTQGYRLRINSSGYKALKANLTPDDFEVFLRSAGHFQPGFKYVDAHTGLAAPENAPFTHKSNSIKHFFSADRAMLRSLLLTDLTENELKYGHAFTRYEMQPNGQVQVYFDNGRSVEGAVVVGADGTTSRVRRQYIPRAATLLDTDSGAIYGKTPITPGIERFFATESTTMIISENPKMSIVMEPRCTTQVNAQEFESGSWTGLPDLQSYICWVLIARAKHFHVRDDISVQDLFAMTPAEMAGLSCEMTRHWAPQVRQLLQFQSPEWCSFLRISTTSPDIKPWAPSPVTLIGDAVHTMVPAGIGCNTALQDARALVHYFKEYGVGIDAVAAYERRMRDYGREAIEISIDSGKQMFGLPSVAHMQPVMY